MRLRCLQSGALNEGALIVSALAHVEGSLKESSRGASREKPNELK